MRIIDLWKGQLVADSSSTWTGRLSQIERRAARAKQLLRRSICIPSRCLQIYWSKEIISLFWCHLILVYLRNCLPLSVSLPFLSSFIALTMSTALGNTSWPDIAISSFGKDLIAKFFSLVDKADPNSGKDLAEEVFTKDGVLIAGRNKFTGYEGVFLRMPIWLLRLKQVPILIISYLKIPRECLGRDNQSASQNF